jgi:hypothetical protein
MVAGMSNPLRRLPIGIAMLAVAFVACGEAWAGPPYKTDDPEPTEKGHWEIYSYASGLRASGATEGDVGVDLNYGAARDLQLTLILPMAYEHFRGTSTGVGTVEVGAKYRFMHQEEGRWRPDVAFFPNIQAPTANRDFGTRHTNLFLPIWIGKDIGEWSIFGGGGYDINPGSGNRDYWEGGLGVTREIGDRLSLGIEMYSRTREADDGKSFTGINVGVTYKLVEHLSLAASFGPGVRNAATEGRYAGYIALKSEY